MNASGCVYLIGAGPGRRRLITVEGARRLAAADVIVYDYLANPRLLDYAPATAERILVGKHGGGKKVSQSVINDLLIDRAQKGKQVARLKGGDPTVFARVSEETRALAAAGVRFVVVPGVSSVTAVPAFAGIPITDRDVASTFSVLTGYEYGDKAAPGVRWDSLARSGGTLVILMTSRQLRANMARLISSGLAADTPAAIVRWGSVARQQVLTGTIATIADQVEAAGLQPPVLAIIGRVVDLREEFRWSRALPLFGRTIAVTRPRAQAAEFMDALEDLGADVVPLPTIEIVDPDSWVPVDDAISRIEEFDWVVFTSVNGVERFFDRLVHCGRDVRALYRARLAAVGPATGRALSRRCLTVDVIPGEFRAEGVAAAMSAEGIRGAKILLPRASAARDILPKMLADSGGCVEEVHVYNTVPCRNQLGEVRQLLAEEHLDMITFTSSSTVTNFSALLNEKDRRDLRASALACIGPITADTARKLGFEVAVSADEYTVDGLLASIVSYFSQPDQELASTHHG